MPLSWLAVLGSSGSDEEYAEDVLEACLADCEKDFSLFFSEDVLPLIHHIRQTNNQLWLSHIFPIIKFWPRDERDRFYDLLSVYDPPAEPKEAPTPSPYSDIYNGEQFICDHGEVLRYCREWRSWHIWDGIQWLKDREDAVYDYARATVRRIGKTGFDTDDARLVKHAMKSSSDASLAAMLHQAGTMTIRTKPEDYDRHLWLLNCPNGTLYLKTGEFAPHDPKNLITKATATDYNPAATCPQWLAFLRQIMAVPDSPEDSAAQLEAKEAEVEAMVTFLQRAVGYSLIGEVQEKILLIPWGQGDNGKSTFIETIAAVLGSDYAMRTPTEIFLSRREGAIPNDVAQLKGVRFAYAAEPPQDRRLGEALIKELTGGDTMSARFMRGEFFNFKPECTLWMATNHKPPTRGNDNALWSRIKLIPFAVSIPKEEQDRELKNKLIGEGEGILAWAIQGCYDWQKSGLGEPEAVKAATAEYRTDNDTIVSFIDDKCVLGPNYRQKTGELYSAYKSHCEATGERPMAQKAFSLQLINKGFEPYANKGRWFLGIGLSDN